jgi:hypothetical protein
MADVMERQSPIKVKRPGAETSEAGRFTGAVELEQAAFWKIVACDPTNVIPAPEAMMV